MQDPRAIMAMHVYAHKQVQWNPSKVDTIGTKDFVCCSEEVSLAQGLVVDHTPPTIAASTAVDDERLYWWEICQLTAPKQEFEIYCSYWSLKLAGLNGGCGLTVHNARLFTIAQAEWDQ